MLKKLLVTIYVALACISQNHAAEQKNATYDPIKMDKAQKRAHEQTKLYEDKIDQATARAKQRSATYDPFNREAPLEKGKLYDMPLPDSGSGQKLGTLAASALLATEAASKLPAADPGTIATVYGYLSSAGTVLQPYVWPISGGLLVIGALVKAHKATHKYDDIMPQQSIDRSGKADTLLNELDQCMKIEKEWVQSKEWPAMFSMSEQEIKFSTSNEKRKLIEQQLKKSISTYNNEDKEKVKEYFLKQNKHYIGIIDNCNSSKWYSVDATCGALERHHDWANYYQKEFNNLKNSNNKS